MLKAIEYKGRFICPVDFVHTFHDGACFYVADSPPPAGEKEKVQREIDCPRFETRAQAKAYCDAKRQISRLAGLLGKVGGRVRSKAKATASRKNGRLGGRPVNLRGGRPKGSKDARPRTRRTPAEIKAAKKAGVA